MDQSFPDFLYSEVFLGLDVPNVEDFNGYLFFVFVVDAFVDFGESSLSNLFEDVVLVDFVVLEVFLHAKIFFITQLKLTMPGLYLPI